MLSLLTYMEEKYITNTKSILRTENMQIRDKTTIDNICIK